MSAHCYTGTLNEPTKSNFIHYAVANYTNPTCLSAEEFFDDIGRIKYIKKLLKRYFRTEELKTRLLLNHIISFYNVFDNEAATKMLFLKIDKPQLSALKSFLVFLNYLPLHWYEDLRTDEYVLERLQEL